MARRDARGSAPAAGIIESIAAAENAFPPPRGQRRTVEIIVAGTAARLQPERRSGERWWCSHLVELIGPAGNSVAVNLENIGPGGAGIASDAPLDAGARLRIRAVGFEADVTVAFCNVRENDFAVGLRFENGFRWSPEIWTPDHFYRPPRRGDS